VQRQLGFGRRPADSHRVRGDLKQDIR